MMRPRLASLRVSGPDSRGIVAASAEILHKFGCGIVQSEHYTIDCHFFQRIVFDYAPTIQTAEAESELVQFTNSRNLHTNLDWGLQKKKVGVMVSKDDHCLWEILLRHQSSELNCDIPLIISNHPHHEPIAQMFGIPYHHLNITASNKLIQEERQLELLEDNAVDVVVLARYMQVLSPRFLQTYPHSIINIHHSFLPAFRGGRAYHRAHERGVKLIGATVSSGRVCYMLIAR
jgi:formyltetrahydrofolate deformylase